MPEITEQSTVEEVAAIVSDALESAGITATLSGGSAVTIYSNNAYLSRDLDFVTANTVILPGLPEDFVRRSRG